MNEPEAFALDVDVYVILIAQRHRIKAGRRPWTIYSQPWQQDDKIQVPVAIAITAAVDTIIPVVTAMQSLPQVGSEVRDVKEIKRGPLMLTTSKGKCVLSVYVRIFLGEYKHFALFYDEELRMSFGCINLTKCDVRSDSDTSNEFSVLRKGRESGITLLALNSVQKRQWMAKLTSTMPPQSIKKGRLCAPRIPPSSDESQLSPHSPALSNQRSPGGSPKLRFWTLSPELSRMTPPVKSTPSSPNVRDTK